MQPYMAATIAAATAPAVQNGKENQKTNQGVTIEKDWELGSIEKDKYVKRHKTQIMYHVSCIIIILPEAGFCPVNKRSLC